MILVCVCGAGFDSILLRTGWAALRGDTDVVATTEAALESKGESELRAKAEAKAARLKALLARSQAIAQRLREACVCVFFLL